MMPFQSLNLKDLRLENKIEITDDVVKKGNVIKTNPEIGYTVKENSKITIYISSGKEKYELSNYLERNYEDVFSLLDNQKF